MEELKEKITSLENEIEKLEKDKEHILKLAVENANANEYCLQELEKENELLKNSLKPFNDDYFKGLSYMHIAELAKKSIRLTSENREMAHLLEDINEKYQLKEEHKKKIEEFTGNIV